MTSETVEIMCDETWIKIPDGTLAVVGRGGDSITVKTASGEKSVRGGDGTSVGDSLKGRVYLGLLHPNGRFVTGTGDPYEHLFKVFDSCRTPDERWWWSERGRCDILFCGTTRKDQG